MKKTKSVTGVQCHKCGDAIRSRSVHDWRTCKCGATFVDGGRDYLRYGTTKECEMPKVVRIDPATGAVLRAVRSKAAKPATAPPAADPDRCPACGVTYIAHLGVNGTCEGYQSVLRVLRQIAATEKPVNKRRNSDRNLARVLRAAGKWKEGRL